MKNTLKIPYGMGEIELTDKMIKDAQGNYYITAPQSENKRIIDAILSYFLVNCLPDSIPLIKQEVQK